MRNEIILFLVVFVLVGLVGIPAGAVNIVGYKFYDYNKDGVAGSNSFPLEGWTIQVKYLNKTDVPGAQDVTDADGLYNISGLDPYFDYYVCEVLQQGWENTTPLCNKTGFDLCSGFGENATYEFYTDQTNLNLYMPNLPDGDSYVLLGWNARIGNAVSNPPGEEEMKIFYPLGQWSGGQSSSGISDGGDVGWVNNTYLPFNATWIPGATLYQNATWTVNGTTVTQTSTHARPNSVPIRDIVIRLHAEKDTGYTVEVNNLTLKQGAHTYFLTHSPLTFHYIDPQNEDLYLLVRASDILTSLDGSDIGSAGFSLTGDVRFSWPDGSTPDGNDIKADILVGRYDCPYVNVQPVNFGNHINGSISGYKFDNQGNPLGGWNITAYNGTRMELYYDITDVNGYYNISNIPLGFYWLNETLKNGYTQVTPNRTVQINVTTLDLMNQNFTNMAEEFCIEGYKVDTCTGLGLEGWNITVLNQNTGAEVGNSTTGAGGYYQVCNLTPGNYTVCEQVEDGWTNETVLCQNVTLESSNATEVNFTNTKLLCISGYKLDTCNGGLEGWQINLTNSTGDLIDTTSTGPDGFYQFCGLLPGNYNVTEVLQSGYEAGTAPGPITLRCNYNETNQNFTNTKLLCISGYKLDTCNGGLEGWQINLTNSTGGLVDTTTTNATGFYQFCGLLPGDYNVTEVLQPGYEAGTAPGPITLACDQNVSNQNFTNTKLLCISGYKLDTCNGGLEGWQINLTNSTGGLVGTTTTNATGFYQFCGVLPGDYNVTEVLQDGYEAGDAPGPITLACDQNVSNQNFTNTKLLCISGYKRESETGQGLDGWNITLSNQSGQVAKVMTNATGYYQVCDLTPGSYTVCEEIQQGWVNETPTCVDVTLTCANATVNFENARETFCVDGYKIDNCTGRGYPNWNISVLNDDEVEVANTSTDQNGYYQVCGLLPGDYTVCEELKPGWTNLTDLCQPVTIADANISNVNFTNSQLFCIGGRKTIGTSAVGVADWNITVSNQSGQVAKVMTNATGYYQVCGLVPGDYTVCEELQPGWTNLSPICQDVTLPCSNLTVNFANQIETFCIDGYKIDDCTGRGIPSWNISVLNDDEIEVANTSTDQNGYYQVCGLLPGDYTVCEELQPGWTNLTDLCQPVTIADANISNVNFTNTRLVCISGYKLDTCNGGLSGWQINLTDSTGGLVGTTTTNATGFYQFCGLVPGDYNVSEVLKPGWVAGTAPGPISLTCDQNVTNQNFTNTKLLCIEGRKTIGTSAVGVADWNITVSNQSGQVAKVITNATGYYQVCGLVPGDYTVCEELQPGWNNLSPICQNVTLACNNQTVNFANEIETFCIDGYKIDNCTGRGIPAWNISVQNNDNVEVASTTTDQNGHYQVCGLLPGDYTVCEVLKPGWTNLTALCQPVTIADANISNVNFTNTRLVCIKGQKINATTGQGLANWNITVSNQSGQVAKVTTNATGYYQVCGLVPGNYIVCEELLPGWMNATPSCVYVTLNCSNTSVTFANFPIVENGSISGYKINQSCGCIIPGWTIRLYNATTGGLVRITKTDATGKYSFTGLPFGSYWVNESPQEAWAAVSPPHVQVNLSMQNPYAVNINFTNFRSFTCNSSDVIIIDGVEKHVICIWDP